MEKRLRKNIISPHLSVTQARKRKIEIMVKGYACGNSTSPQPSPPQPTPTPCPCEEEIEELRKAISELYILTEEWKEYTNYYTYPHLKK